MSKWTEENRKKPRGSKCGAKAKSTGLLCQSYAMPNGRCRMHGGIVRPERNRNQFAKGNKASVKHGLYSDRIFDDEKRIYPAIEVGNLDEEIKMLKIKLRRTHGAQKILEKQHRSEEIRSLSTLIGQVELKRKKLMATGCENFTEKIVQRFREVSDEAFAKLTGGETLSTK
jgi:hypothetical protein